MNQDPKADPGRSAAQLKQNWQRRAQSEHRDFYVASHPGWDQEEHWRRQAETDVGLMLHGLEDDWLRRAAVFEIGCGVGRLAPALLARCASYTGCDIAPAMVEEARQRVPEGAEFYVSDGLTAPAEVEGRQFDLIFSLAVLVHCPREVVSRLAADAVSRLSPGGRFRFQLLADSTDPTGYEPSAAAELAHEEMREMEAQAPEATVPDMVEHDYMGHAFGFEEARELFGSLGGELQLLRLDLMHIYGELRR